MFKDNSVIIVGNGSSLIENEYGQIIDEFDLIVRFNSYTIKGYEKFTGIKTDYWYNTVNFQNKFSEPRMNYPYKKIILHSWQWDWKKDDLFNQFKEFYRDKNVPLEKTTKESFFEMRNYSGNDNYFFSTGAIAIWNLLKQYPKLIITGFDWWSNNKHHYNDKVSRGTLHNPEIEYQFIKKLQNENKLSFLSEIVTLDDVNEIKEKPKELNNPIPLQTKNYTTTNQTTLNKSQTQKENTNRLNQKKLRANLLKMIRK